MGKARGALLMRRKYFSHELRGSFVALSPVQATTALSRHVARLGGVMADDVDGPGRNYSSWRQVFQEETRTRSRFVPPSGAILQTRRNLKTGLPEKVWLLPYGGVLVRPDFFNPQVQKESVPSDDFSGASAANKKRRDFAESHRHIRKLNTQR